MKTKDDSAISTRTSSSTKSSTSLRRAETFVAESKRIDMSSGDMETDQQTVRVNVKEAKAKFFQSMQESSSTISSKGEKASRIGMSILPLGILNLFFLCKTLKSISAKKMITKYHKKIYCRIIC